MNGAYNVPPKERRRAMKVTVVNPPSMDRICETLERIYAARGTPIKIRYTPKEKSEEKKPEPVK